MSEIDVPKKPRLPILLQAALVLWGSTALIYANSPLFMSNGELQLAGVNVIIPAIALCALTGLCCLIWFAKRPKSKLLLLIATFAIGVVVGLTAGASNQSNQTNVLQLEQGQYCFKIESDQTSSSYYNSAEATIISGSEDSADANYKVKLQCSTDTEEIHAGDIIQANVKFSSASDTQQSNYWQNGILANARASTAEKLEDNSTIGYIYKFRNAMISTLRALDNPEDGSYSQAEQLLAAIVCGERIDLQNGDVYDAFRNCGLAHLVAVSGAHLSLVTAILLVLLKKLRVKKWLTIVIQSMFIFAYLICAAIPVSALRAAFMAYIAIFAFFSRRRPAPLNAIGICIIVLIAIDPTTSVSISFALSAGSTIGIILFARLFEYWICKLCPRCPEFIKSALSLTFAASVCSQPLSVSIFNQLPLISPVANVVCAPLFSVICGLGLVISVVCTAIMGVAPTLAQFIYLPAKMLSDLMCEIVRLLAAIPYACIPATLNIYVAILITLALCTVLYKVWPNKDGGYSIAKIFSFNSRHDKQTESTKYNELTSGYESGANFARGINAHGCFVEVSEGSLKEGAVAHIFVPDESSYRKSKKPSQKFWFFTAGAFALVMIIFLLSILLPHANGSELIMLDVGQGDSILLKSEGKTFMIDTGNQDSKLKQRLAEQNIAHLDGLLITHPDDDHCGSMDVVQNMVQVDNFYCASDLPTCQSDNCKKLMSNAYAVTNNIVKLKVGDKIEMGNIEMEVIWPDKYSDEGGNADSLCLMANFDENRDSVVDATALLVGDAEKDQISDMFKKGRLQNVDIYKVGHHGSKNAITQNDAKKLSPKMSLVSVGEKNRYGHPAKTTLDMLSGSQIFRTDTQGTITVDINADKINVKTEKQGERCINKGDKCINNTQAQNLAML